jgi:hypothetical protein
MGGFSMRFHLRGKEKNVGYSDVYLKAGLIGAFVAGAFIGGGKVIKFIIKLLIEYWLWALACIAFLIILRRFIFKRKEIQR